MADFAGAPCNYGYYGVMEYQNLGYRELDAGLTKNVVDKLVAWLKVQ